ncbi:protein transport protein SEC13 [Testicularia cyperi]|uniref:Protein transport protein SEC13 n=1 Tax=Testicularia cyperi TaxID=1882483 RepID=A0A317XTH2_9BASI|nr:protein transport protein SEC13 [Testicularia cyperi]
MSALAASSASLSLSADKPKNIETQHEDMIHDAQLDFYGKRLATCSSDRTVKVFDIVNGAPSSTGETLQGHQGPVWQVAWAHPTFGDILASCSYDGKVIIWKDNGAASSSSSSGPYGSTSGAYGAAPSTAGGWSTIKEHALHTASVNSIAWAPHELGSILACASSDGNVSVLTFNNDGTWAVDIVSAHPIGCNAVSWAPAVMPGSLISAQTGQPGSEAGKVMKRFASAGCDNAVKIWEYSDEANRYVEVDTLQGHTDWVRDVAFAPNIGLPRSYLATASQDRTVLIWTQDSPSSAWTKTALNPTNAASTAAPNKFPDTVWRVSWSVSGNVLAVSCGDGKVTLWKENLKGAWECVSEMDA